MATVQKLTTRGNAATDSAKLARVFAAIYECVDKYRTGISFVNLADAVGKDSMGDQVLESVSRSNVVYWGGVSPEFAEAVTALMAGNVLRMYQCAPLVYMIDGRMPELPLAADTRDYETLHWQPALFEAVERRK